MTIDQTQLKNLGSKNNKAYLSANAYFKARGADAVPYLVEQAEAEKANDDPLTRQRIAMLLGHIGDPRGFATLEGLASDPLEETRYDAVVALGNLRDPRCLPLLLDIFQRGDDQEYVVPTLACY